MDNLCLVCCFPGVFLDAFPDSEPFAPGEDQTADSKGRPKGRRCVAARAAELFLGTACLGSVEIIKEQRYIYIYTY